MMLKAVILAGGKGTRLREITHNVIPKPMVPIREKPILEILLKQLKHFGFKDVVIAVGHLSYLIENYFGTGEQLGLNISYSKEEKPLGTAAPLKQISGLDDTFIVINGDTLTTLDFQKLVENHKESRASATICIKEREVTANFGVIKYDDNHELMRYIEKPTTKEFVSIGVNVFEPDALEFIKPGEYFDMPDLMQKLKASGKKVKVYMVEEEWMDIGRPDDFNRAVDLFEEKENEFLHTDEK